MKNKLSLIAFALALAAIGAVGGWIGATQSGAKAGQAPAEAVGHTDEAPALSAQTLKNLQVTSGAVQLSEFVRCRNVLAVVVDPPLNTRQVYAPLGGIVTEVRAVPGTAVVIGASLLALTRDAIPRPELKLTAAILTPVSENLHESVSQLRTAVSHLRIAQKELARIAAFTQSGTVDGLPILPRKAEIDVRYEVDRAEQEVANSRNEMERHGLSAAEVDAVQSGKAAPDSQKLWKRALERNGLWTALSEEILRTLPERQQDAPWSVAALGELAAAGLTSDELLLTLKDVAGAAKHFVEVAGLLLEGHTVAQVRLLAEVGALEPIITIKAPADGPPDWDVAEVSVRPGQRVAAGATLAVLHDPRTMSLRLDPVGEDLAAVVRALEQRVAVSARALIAQSGPAMSALQIERMETREAAGERGAHALVACKNAPVESSREDGKRSWRLRSGLRYVVSIPVEVLKDRFVLPADAVTNDGPDRVVFVIDGDGFKRRSVHLEYEDDRQVVIANDGSLFSGDRVVLTGAFQLGLALQTGKGASDSHAGHNH